MSEDETTAQIFAAHRPEDGSLDETATAAECYVATAGRDLALALLLAAEDVLTLRRISSFGMMRDLMLNIEQSGGR
jgi:hypothetical protein